MTQPGKIPTAQAGIGPKYAVVEADAFTTRPNRGWSTDGYT